MAEIVRFYETGGSDVLRIESYDPGKPGPGEVLMQVEAIGVNRMEVAFRYGEYLVDPALPSGLGAEGVGRILALGEGVEGWKIGDRACVIPFFMQGGRYVMYATQAVLPASSLIVAPDSLDAIACAALWLAPMTAWGAMVQRAGLARGDFALIPAASSSVGLAAIQVCHAIGAIPIAATRSSSKVSALTQAGATHVIVTDDDDVQAEVARITDGKGARVILDPVAGSYAATLAPTLSPEGTLIVYGGLSGEMTEFPRRLMMRKGASYMGFNAHQVIHHPERLSQFQAFILDGLRRGVIAPRVDRVFDFHEVAAAHDYLESNVQVGKVVMTTASAGVG